LPLVENLEISIRLDKYIKTLFPSITQGFIEKALRNGDIKLNSSKTKSNQKIDNGDNIHISDYIFKKFDGSEIIDKEEYIPNKNLLSKVKNNIIYENNDFIVLNKPVGLACQGGTNLIHSLDKLMNHLYEKEIRIVHRLDKDTTDVLLMAKNLKSAQFLTGLFKEHKIQKTYSAVSIKNHLNDKNIAKLQKRILNSETIELNAPLKSMTIGGEEKIVIDFQIGKEAISKIKLLNVKDDLYHFEITPLTGRKHQIRAHLEYLGFPIFGDKKYGKPEAEFDMHLHSHRLVINELGICFKADFPDKKLFQNIL